MNRLFLLIVFFVSSAFAFRPTEEGEKRETKIRAIEPSKEMLSLWRGFNKSNKWKVQFNPATGIPKRIWGFHTKASKEAPLEIGKKFLSENQQLLQIETKNIKLFNVERRQRFNHLTYQQVYQGLTVEGANLILSLTNDGRIVSVASNYYPEIETKIAPIIAESRAIEIAKDDLILKSDVKERVELVILPKNRGILCWKVRFFCQDPLGDWVYYITADKGKIIERYNNLRFQTSGRVMGMIFPSVGADLLSLLPFSHQRVNVGTGNTITDDEGYYKIEGTGSISSELKGCYVDVDNEDSLDALYGEWKEFNHNLSSPHPYPNDYIGSWTITSPGAKRMKVHFTKLELEQNFDYLYLYDGSGTLIERYTGVKTDFWSKEIRGDVVKICLQTDESGVRWGFDIDRLSSLSDTDTTSWTWSYSPYDTHIDEVNVFYHLNLTNNYYKNTHNYSLASQIKAIVHYGTEYDNAFYWPDENVICFGDGDICEDFAQSRDVICHEYTHAVTSHIYNLLPYGQAGAMDEALADYFTAAICNDPNIGEWVMPKEDQRNLVNTFKYPEDWQGEVHSDGRIYAGALWELRQSLANEADRLIFESLFFQPQSFREGLLAILLADDDDGDLSNGTPHHTEIETAFGHHGISLAESSDTYEPNDFFSQAYELTSKNLYESYIFAPGDMDYYKLWADTGTISISLTSIPLTSDYDLYLYNSSFGLIDKSINAGSEDEIICYDLGTSSGLYYILVTGWKKYYSPSNSYLLQAIFSYGKKDNTPPFGSVTTPIDRGDYGGQAITFFWTEGGLNDPESGIAGYWLDVGTTPGGSNRFSGDVGDVLSKTIFDCGNGKTYYARVRARNGAGLYGSWSAVSDGITIDATSPFGVPSIPIDSEDYSTSTTISFNWTKGGLNDPESGIAGYWLDVGTTPGGINRFSGDVGDVLSKAIFECEDGKTYYARVRARNGAGLYGSWSAVSDG
ncbi:hypothetical protein KKG61_04855, partial [bacterium]|nr:hypothetical protein [bacterium]